MQTQATVKIRKVTPQMAEAWLQSNKSNRKLRANKVRQWAKVMERGEWTLSPDCIAFDTEGVLVNGQHRLAAVVDTRTPQEFVLLENVPAAAQAHTDVGLKRQAADYFHMALGERNTSMLASCLSLVHHWRAGRQPRASGGADPLSVEQLEGLFLSDPERFRQAVEVGRQCRHVPAISPSTAAALWYLFAEIDTHDADEFFRLLASGAGLPSKNPILALRSLLTNYALRQLKVTVAWRFAVVIKAWNAYREGRDVEVVRWRSTDPIPMPE